MKMLEMILEDYRMKDMTEDEFDSLSGRRPFSAKLDVNTIIGIDAFQKVTGKKRQESVDALIRIALEALCDADESFKKEYFSAFEKSALAELKGDI